MDNLNENNQQKSMIVVYMENIYKNLFAKFWCYRVYKCSELGSDNEALTTVCLRDKTFIY